MRSKIELHPMSQMTEACTGTYMIYKDYFWIVDKDYFWIVDKDNNLLKYRGMSWQCNAHKEVVETLKNSCYPECTVVQIPYVYSKISD